MRLYELLNHLKNENRFLSVEYLSDVFNVSKRTIQSDLSFLLKISPRKGFQLHMKRGEGYLLEITNTMLFNEYMKSVNVDDVFPQKERPNLILSYILMRKDYTTLDEISNTFNISKALVKSDMKNVEKLIVKHGLMIEKRSHYGVRIYGKVENLLQYLVEEYLNQNTFVYERINETVCDFDCVIARFIDILNQFSLSINYNELINLTSCLRVMTFLSFKNIQKYAYALQDGEIELIVLKFLEVIADTYGVYFNDECVNVLVNVAYKNIRNNMDHIVRLDTLQHHIEVFLKKTDEIYGTTFMHDSTFKQQLYNHVSLLIDRLHSKISYKNQLANEISITHTHVFNIALQFSEMLKEYYQVDVTFDETGFIAMHFMGHMEKEKQMKLQSYNHIAIVCSSGGGSAYMIKMQIQNIFPGSEVETFSYLHQEKIVEYLPDLIMTVMPLSIDVSVPIIYIKELLSDKDLYKIKMILQTGNGKSYSLDKPVFDYYQYFHKEFFQISNKTDYLEFIEMMADDLENKGYGNEGYKNLVLQREEYVSTVYLNGICIPHPLEINAKKNMISVCVLPNSISHLEREVSVIFMVCLTKDAIEDYKKITRILYSLMKNKNLVSQMKQVHSFEEMMAILKEIGEQENE